MAITRSGTTITVDSGRTASTATSGASTTLTDTGQTWTTNAEADHALWIHTGTGSGQIRRIASNTATVLTVDRAWATNPDNTSQYVILYNWADVQSANDTGTWGIATTNGNNIYIDGDIQFGAGTNFGGIWDYDKTVEVRFPSVTTYSTNQWLMKNNAMWGDGDEDINGNPINGSVYTFNCSQTNVTGVDLLNFIYSPGNDDQSFFIRHYDTRYNGKENSATQPRWLFLRMRSNSDVVQKGVKSSHGPAGRWSSTNTVVDGAIFHDCFDDWALSGAPTNPLVNVTVYNANAGAQVSDPGADYDNWVWHDNTEIISMGGFTSPNIFYITDCYMSKDKDVGLLQQSDISCSASLGNAAAAGNLIERKRVSYNVVDSSGTAIQNARVYMENTSGTSQFNVTTDASGDTVVTKVDVQEWSGSSSPGTNNVPPVAATVYNPMTVKVREYDYNFLQETFTLEFPITLQSKALSDNTFVSVSRATAAAYTGISINHSTGVVTITSDHTIQELYDYSVNDMTQSANMQYDPWLTTADGVNFTSTYDITVTGAGVQFTSTTHNINFSGSTLTVASGGFYEDTNGARWEVGGVVNRATHFFHRAVISGTSTAIQNAVVAYYSGGTNYTYNTSLTNTALTTDASGDVEGYVVYQIDATPVTGHELLCREYDYNLFSSPATINGTPIGTSGSPSQISLVADGFVGVSKATASGYTGLTITHSGTPSFAIASTSRTVQQAYDYAKYDLTLAANFNRSAWFTTVDGVNFSITYNTTITGVNLVDESSLVTFGGTLTLASGAKFEDGDGAQWESGGSQYYGTHFRHRALISGTSTAIQNAVIAYYETDTNTNVTYNTSLALGALTTDASGDVDGYAVYRIDAATYGGHELRAREYDYNLYTSPSVVNGAPFGASGSPVTVSMVVDGFVVVAKATAAAYTGITITHSGTPSLAVASTNRTVQQVYDYNKYNITLAANFDRSAWLTTVDGINYTFGYNTTVTGVDLVDESASVTFSGTLTVASSGLFEDSNGAIKEIGGAISYLSHIRLEANIDGSSTSIPGAIFSAFETSTNTNVTYDTSFNIAGLISDASGQVEGYIEYRRDATTYAGHTLVIGEYDYLWSTLPITVDGGAIGSSGSFNIFFLRSDANKTLSKAAALAVTGVTVGYSTKALTTTTTAPNTYDNLKARQTRYTDIDTGKPGIDSFYEISLYNGGDGNILAHTGAAHSLADTWDMSIATDYGYPLELDNSTLSLTATGSYTNITLTDNATVDFEAIGTFTLDTGIVNTASSTFDNQTAGAVTVNMDPAATTPTLANTGGGGNPTINKVVSITIDDGGVLPDGARVMLYNDTAAAEIDNSVVAGGAGYSFTITSGTDYTVGDQLTLSYAYVSGSSTAYLPDSQAFIANTSDISLVIVTANDTVYTTNAIDGSGVTEFATDFINVQVDINDPNNVTIIERVYAWFAYQLTTANGIRNWFGGITAEDIANYRINTAIIDLKLENVGTAGLLLSSNQSVGGRMYRDDTTSIWASTTNGASDDFGRVFVQIVNTTGSPVITGDIADVPTAAENAAALLATQTSDNTTAGTVSKAIADGATGGGSGGLDAGTYLALKIGTDIIKQ